MPISHTLLSTHLQIEVRRSVRQAPSITMTTVADANLKDDDVATKAIRIVLTSRVDRTSAAEVVTRFGID